MIKPKNELSPEARKKVLERLARIIPRIEAEQAKKKESA